jgi:hypothetical protein
VVKEIEGSIGEGRGPNERACAISHGRFPRADAGECSPLRARRQGKSRRSSCAPCSAVRGRKAGFAPRTRAAAPGNRDRPLRAECCRRAATVGLDDSSTSTGDLLCPLYVDPCRSVKRKESLGWADRSRESIDDESPLRPPNHSKPALPLPANHRRFAPNLAVQPMVDAPLKRTLRRRAGSAAVGG